jgi:hypothetical protein
MTIGKCSINQEGDQLPAPTDINRVKTHELVKLAVKFQDEKPTLNILRVATGHTYSLLLLLAIRAALSILTL